MAVIVGVDGSEAALRALTWAATEARLRGETLRAIYVHPMPVPTLHYAYSMPAYEQFTDDDKAAGENLLRDMLDRSAADTSGVEVQLDVIPEVSPADALQRQAGPDDLLVVGSRGRGGFRGLLLGSVSQQLVQHARCPTVVLPAKSDGG